MAHETKSEYMEWKAYEVGIDMGKMLYNSLIYIQAPDKDLRTIVTFGILSLMIKCFSEMDNPPIEIPDILQFKVLCHLIQNEMPLGQLRDYLEALGSICYYPEWGERIYRELVECGIEKDRTILQSVFDVLAGMPVSTGKAVSSIYVTAAVQFILSVGEMPGTGLSGVALIPIEVLMLLKKMTDIKAGDICYGATCDSVVLLPFISPGQKCTNIFNYNRQNYVAAIEMIQVMSQADRRNIFPRFEQPCVPCDSSVIRGRCDHAFAFTPLYRQMLPTTERLLWLDDKNECIAWWPEYRQANQWIYARHIAASLSKNGRGYIFMPLGTMSRGGNEAEIRQLFIEENLIDMVIEFPGGTFGRTNTSIALLVLRKGRQRDDVYMVNLSGKEGKKHVAVNTRSHVVDFKDMEEISAAIRDRKPIDGLADLISCKEIVQNACSFSPSAYVFEKKQIVAEKIDDLILEKKALDEEYKRLNEYYQSSIARYQQMSRNWRDDRR